MLYLLDIDINRNQWNFLILYLIFNFGLKTITLESTAGIGKKQFLEIPKLLTLVGAGLIIISSVIIFMRESELKKKVVSSRPWEIIQVIG